MSTNPISPALPPMDPSSPFGLFDGIAFRHQMMLRDYKMVNDARYTAYALVCHDQAIGVTAGRVDPTAPAYVEGQAGWPPMPREVGIDKNAAGFEFVETDENGPRTLDQVDPWSYPVLTPPADEHLSDAQRRAALPQGVIDIGKPEGDPSSGIFDVGPKDTWPAGVVTPPDPATGHTYVKFSWAGLGFKYERVK